MGEVAPAVMDATTWHYGYTHDVLVPRLIFPYDTPALPTDPRSEMVSRMPAPSEVPHTYQLDTSAITVAVCCAAWMVACSAYLLYAFQMEIFHHLVPESKRAAPEVKWKIQAGKPRSDGVVIKVSTFPRCREECARERDCVGLAYNAKSFTCNLYSDIGSMVDEEVKGWSTYSKPVSRPSERQSA